MNREFSLKAVLVGGVITFLISGVGGALLTRYLARAKPSAVIVSVGFTGGSDFIRIDDDLMQKSEQDAWGGSFSRFEQFNTILQREQDSREFYELLNLAARESQSWLDRHNTSTEAKTPSVPAEALEVHPVMRKAVFMSLIAGAVLRQELTRLPVELKPNPGARVFYLSESKDDDGTYNFELKLPKMRVGIYCRDPKNQAQLWLTRQIAESFAQANRRNVVFLTQFFIGQAGTDCRALEEMQQALTPTLLKNARLRLSVDLVNTGDRPVVLRPYFIASLLHQEFKRSRFVLEAHVPEPAPTPTDLGTLLGGLGKPKTSRGTDIEVKPFLPTTSHAEYIALGPGATKSIVLVGCEPLGDLGEKVKRVYATGVLDCRVSGLTLSGTAVRSEIANFGDLIGEKDKQLLLALRK